MKAELSEAAKVEIYNTFLNMNVDCEETSVIRKEILTFFEQPTKKDNDGYVKNIRDIINAIENSSE